MGIYDPPSAAASLHNTANPMAQRRYDALKARQDRNKLWYLTDPYSFQGGATTTTETYILPSGGMFVDEEPGHTIVNPDGSMIKQRG